ncbi:E3 ubiquitin-protein ligase [Raphanus sativus]|uniref:RING-type E3 ubiquitin transferase n=1 Tax=Raphanus sativus TaxID=3726 RepID=A0A6J0L8C1_RAPSA|nr:E3 ubiquitin-protein ligase At4g11680 isoform X1 [Raphanus sativus]KAJ4876305.1 E3 ubiquitin-protein ligase [Raphanus sativus]
MSATTNTTGTDSAPYPPSSRVGRANSDGIIDTTPLLPSGVTRTASADGENGIQRSAARRQGLREAARFLRHAGSRRMMREPSMLVRETAAEQLEERQSDWAYSKPVVFLDILWNLAFVAIGVAVLILSRDERPNMPLRVWVVGYGVQCGLHMACVCVEYRRRRCRRRRDTRHGSSASSSQQYVSLAQLEDTGNTSGLSNSAKHLESANTMFSFIWWVIGFYWVSAGGQTLSSDAPQLYWLCIIFLGFDVFFVVFCVALACVVGLAVCCCLPCIIAILYAIADEEGASKKDIDQMPKFRFRKIGNGEKLPGETTDRGIMTECGTDSPIERSLSSEDSECCICLCEYEDGVELRELPCNHHFHCTCIDKWLHINSRCPLCKFNILKNENEV